MTTYLGALSHGAHTIVINRDGRNIYRLLIAQRAQHEGPQAILSLVYGWHVAAGIVQALRQVRDTDRTAPAPGPLDGQEPLIET